MTEKDIKPIPKYMLNRIRKLDKFCNKRPSPYVRFYSYLAMWHGEVVKVTVAVKNKYKKWYCKQVAVHMLHSNTCFAKDIVCYVMGY